MIDTHIQNTLSEEEYCDWFRNELDKIEVEPWVAPNPAKLPMTKARRDIERCVPNHLLEAWYAKHNKEGK